MSYMSPSSIIIITPEQCFKSVCLSQWKVDGTTWSSQSQVKPLSVWGAWQYTELWGPAHTCENLNSRAPSLESREHHCTRKRTSAVQPLDLYNYKINVSWWHYSILLRSKTAFLKLKKQMGFLWQGSNVSMALLWYPIIHVYLVITSRIWCFTYLLFRSDNNGVFICLCPVFREWACPREEDETDCQAAISLTWWSWHALGLSSHAEDPGGPLCPLLSTLSLSNKDYSCPKPLERGDSLPAFMKVSGL